jgi:hypothetical protein
VKRAFVAIVVVVAVVVSGAFFLELDAPELGRIALASAGRSFGIDLSAAEYRWSFRRGLVLEGVEASSVVLGGRLTLRLEELVFEHRLLPLLTGTVAIERVKLARPRVKLSSLRLDADSPRRPPSAGRPSREEQGREVEEPPERPSTEFYLDVSEVAIEKGALLWQREGGRADLSLNGLDLVLSGLSYDSRALTLVHGLDAAGEIRASSVRWAPISVRELHGRLELAKGKIEMRSGALETENGVFDAEFDLNLNQLPPGYEVRLAGPWDLQSVMGSADGVGSVGLEMEASGFGGGFDNLKGTGTVTLKEGKLPPWPLCRAIDMKLDEPALVGSSYEEVTAPFRIEKGHVHLQDLEVRTDRGTLRFEGTVSFDGPVNLKVMVLMTSGEVHPVVVTGTLEKPVVIAAEQ